MKPLTPQAELSSFRRWWTQPCGGREVLGLALPLVLSTASWTIMHFVDRVFLTWYSTEAIAAAMPAGMLHFSMLCFPLGLAGYINTFVAQYYGAGRKHRIGLVVWQGIWLGMLAIPAFLLLIPVAPWIFAMAGHGEQIAELETTYFQTLAWGAGGAVVSAALAAFFTGLGHARVVLAVDSSAAILNLILDYLLIFGISPFPELGIFGAGIATSISQWAKVVAYFLIIYRREFRVPYRLVEGFRLDGALLRRVLKFGGPSGFQLFFETLAFTAFLFLMGRLGQTALAATTIAFSVNSFAFVPMLGLGIAVTTLVGQQLGRNDPPLAERATWVAFWLGGLYVGTMALLYLLVPSWFLSAHAAGSNPADFHELQRICTVLLRFVALYCLFDMTHIVFVSAIKGAGDTRFVLIITLIVSPVPVVLGYFGTKQWNWSLNTFWFVITAWICGLGIIYLARFWQGKWRTMRVIEPDPEETVAPAGELLPASGNSA